MAEQTEQDECQHLDMTEDEDNGLVHVSCMDCPYWYTIDPSEVP